MNRSIKTTPSHLSFDDPSSEGCLTRCIGGGGSTNNPIFNKRKNANINALDLDEGLIANALTQMSIGKRSQVYESIHGVEEIKDEDNPEHILALQDQMKQEINRLVADPNGPPQMDALKLALKANQDYVLQPKQLLRFLRSDMYDPAKAAGRLARYFDWKLELWSIDKLTRDIVFDDLSRDEQEFYKLGYTQRLPTRDRAGREVWVRIQMNQKNPDDIASFARHMFYSGTPVEESEKLGLVLIALYLEGFRWDRYYPKELQVYSRVIEDLPVKVASIHQCYIDNKTPGVANAIKYFLTLMDEETRARVKIHQGSYTEICYALMTFGIPHTTIPLTHDDKCKTKCHHDRIRTRETLEAYRAEGNSLLMIELPLNSDVLLGKGIPIQSHPGNIHLQAIVDDYTDKYHAMTNKKEKTKLATDIVNMLKQASVRFLSKESGVWMEVEDGIAREKVSQAFRNRKKHAKKVDLEPVLALESFTNDQAKLSPQGKANSKRFKSMRLV